LTCTLRAHGEVMFVAWLACAASFRYHSGLHAPTTSRASSSSVLVLATLNDPATDADARFDFLQRELAAEAAASRQRELEGPASALIDATRGLERGAVATAAAAARVDAAVAIFETACPCTLSGRALLDSFYGTWELVYSKRLYESSRMSRRQLLNAARPTIGGLTQTVQGRDERGVLIDEAVTLTPAVPLLLPLLPRQIRIVLSRRLSTAGGVGEYASEVEELALYGGGPGGRLVALPSPRRVLAAVLGEAGNVLPLEATLLSELEPRDFAVPLQRRPRQIWCTASLLGGTAPVRVLRSGDDLQVFVQTDVGMGPPPRAAVSVGALPAAEPASGLPSSEPVGEVDANGVPIEEFWIEGVSGLSDDWWSSSR